MHAVVRTVHTGGHGPGGSGYLPWETGTFDRLRSLLNLVLVAAAMGGDHLTRSCFHMHCETGGRQTHTTQHPTSIPSNVNGHISDAVLQSQ